MGADVYIEGVAVSPDFANDGTLLVSVRGQGHFRSMNRGQTFTPMAEQLTDDQLSFSHFAGMMPKFPSIVFSPNYAVDKTIYAYSGGSLFRSTDAGDHWERIPAPERSWFDRRYVDARYLSWRLFGTKLHASMKFRVLVIAICGLAVIALNRRRKKGRVAA